MNATGFDSHRPPWPGATLLTVAATVILLLIAAWAWGPWRSRPEPAPIGDGLRVSLSVEPFEVGDSVPTQWSAAGFADSLAAQLSLIRGIEAAAQSSNAHYVLRGHVSMKDGRLILATRLGRDGARDTVWTATFWRSAASGSSVLTDLAQAVAEAVFKESAQEPFNRKRDKP